MNWKLTLSLGCAFAAALSLRVWLMSYAKCTAGDSVSYIHTAQGLGSANSEAALFPPGYPLLIALTKKLLPSDRDWEYAARLTSVVFGALVILPLFFLTREVFGGLAAGCSVALAAVYPALVLHSIKAMSEVTYACCFTCAALCAYLAGRLGKVSLWAVSGALFGYAFLVRPEALVFLGILPLLAFSVFFTPLRTYPKRLAAALLFGLLFVSIALPYWVHLRKATGRWMLSMKGRHALSYTMTTGARNILLARDAYLAKHTEQPSLIGTIRKHPLLVTRAFVVNLHATHKHIMPVLFPALALALFALGLTYPRAGRESLRAELYLAGLMVGFLPIFLFEVAPRVFMPGTVLGIIYMGRGVTIVGAWLHAGLRKCRIPLSHRNGTVAAALACMMPLVPFTLRPFLRPDEMAIYRQVGEWMKANLPAPLRVCHRHNAVSFYAQADQVWPPLGSYKEIIGYCRKEKATHMIVDTRITQASRPTLRFLIYCEKPPPELTRVKVFEDALQTRVVVYRINY